MTTSIGIHFDTDYTVEARRTGYLAHFALTVTGPSGFTMYFESEGEARSFLAIALHELNRAMFPVEEKA